MPLRRLVVAAALATLAGGRAIDPGTVPAVSVHSQFSREAPPMAGGKGRTRRGLEERSRFGKPDVPPAGDVWTRCARRTTARTACLCSCTSGGSCDACAAIECRSGTLSPRHGIRRGSQHGTAARRCFTDDEAAGAGCQVLDDPEHHDCQSVIDGAADEPIDDAIAPWSDELTALRARYERDGWVVVSGLIPEAARVKAEDAVVSQYPHSPSLALDPLPHSPVRR
jgi:hypothetical protein